MHTFKDHKIVADVTLLLMFFDDMKFTSKEDYCITCLSHKLNIQPKDVTFEKFERSYFIGRINNIEAYNKANIKPN